MVMDPRDSEFVRMFERCELAEFHHRDHVRLAWRALREWGWDSALVRVRDGIRAFAAYHNASQKYHETMTIAWLAAVAEALKASPGEDDFDRFVSAHPWLLDRDALHAHYSPELLASDRARAGWVDPDLRPFASAVARSS
jgi:hypothetical protein